MEASLQPRQYAHLFGVEQIQAQVVEHLSGPDLPWVVVIAGIGGIGKTALADAVVRYLGERFKFEQVIWLRSPASQAALSNTIFDDLIAKLWDVLSSQQPRAISSEERIAQVRAFLKQQQILIVIDNLETEADTIYLLDHLNDLASPSKFLITSRTRPPGRAAVMTFSLGELSPGDTLELLRHHAGIVGLQELVNTTKTQMELIYDVVGGNPLALKLVVGLALVQPLSQILSDLMKSRSGEIEELYRHIFLKTWQTLSSPAQALLQAMPLVAESGALPAQMQAISKLPETQFWSAVSELAERSLLEIRGTAWERRYGIHRLTETFLRTDIIHMPEDKS
jgi:hypothetical protein